MTTKTVFVSGAAGQISYSLLPLIASGQVFGPTCRVKLQLLEVTPALQALAGVVLELQDGAYPLLDREILTTDKVEVALKGADVAVFVGGFPRKVGMERKDLIAQNSRIFEQAGKALERVASKEVKILVVANPANTNCLILRQNAPSLPAENFTCLTRLDYNRALFQIAQKTNTHQDHIANVTIWGNHSATQVPDVSSATINGKPASQVINDEAWIKGPFVSTVQQRGKAVIDARKLSSAMSAANAIGDHLRTWLVTGTAPGRTVPMGVVSNGEYGIEKGLVYSYPLTIEKGGKFKVATGFAQSEWLVGKMRATEKELQEEKAEGLEALKASSKL